MAQTKPYSIRVGYDEFDDIGIARLYARMTIEDCIELCDISLRTWYRWRKIGAPRWAIRLIESQIGRLDPFGWKDWEIRGGCLYYNKLDYRYFWTPNRLVLPLYNVKDPSTAFRELADNLTSFVAYKEAQQDTDEPDSVVELATSVISPTAHNI